MVDRGSLTNRNHDLSRFVGEEIRSFLPVPEARLLPADFEPNPWTVICGRGKTSFNHVGNRRFRILCDLNLEAYEATTKTEKSFLVMHIVDAVRDGQGAFVKQDPFTKEWFQVSDAVAREKVGSQLRELLAKRNGTADSGKPRRRRSSVQKSTDAVSMAQPLSQTLLNHKNAKTPSSFSNLIPYTSNESLERPTPESFVLDASSSVSNTDHIVTDHDIMTAVLDEAIHSLVDASSRQGETRTSCGASFSALSRVA